MDEIKPPSATVNSPSGDLGPASSIVKPFEENDTSGWKEVVFSRTNLLVILLAVTLGLATGLGLYFLGQGAPVSTTKIAGRDIEVVRGAKEEGVKDAATFRDTATGELLVNDGKITDEGTHILKRGDVSQNVYLTSSVVDLSKYEGKSVQVWGETYKGQRAGWLMDVGRIRIH